MLCDYSVLLLKPEMISTNKCISDGESMIMTLKKQLHPTGGGRGGQPQTGTGSCLQASFPALCMCCDCP